MSASVWFEEVDTGLVNEIKRTVRITDQAGNSVPLDDHAIVIRKPEEDFKIEVFPCISIYNRNNKFDPMRYDPNPQIVGRAGGRAELEDSAKPFNLSYQLDFWAKYQRDMNAMTRTWLASHFRQFNLEVIHSGGHKRTVNSLAKGSLIRSDLTQGGKRLFHSVLNLQIWVVIDEQVRYNKPMVINREIETGIIDNND